MTQQRDQVKTVQATGAGIDLRCPQYPRRRFGIVFDGAVYETHCRSCSTPTVKIYHRFDVATGEVLPNREERQAA